MVFGYHCEVTSEDDYDRYLESIHNQYYLVTNEKKTELIKQYIFDKNNIYLEPSVLIVDGNQPDWLSITGYVIIIGSAVFKWAYMQKQTA